MDDDSARRLEVIQLGSPAAGSIWRFTGIGLRPLSQTPFWYFGVCLVVGFTIWGYVSIVPTGRIVPGHTDWHRTDFTVFTEAGSAFFDGRDPYRVANPRGWHYLYPPLFALLVAPLSVLATESQVAIWYAVNVALTFGCFGEARRLWRIVGGPDPGRFLWLCGCAFLAMVLPFLDCMQAGQLGIGILYLLMLGCRLVVEGRSWAIWFLGGLTLSLPASIKLVPALPVVFLLFQQWLAVVLPNRRRREWGRAISSSAGVLAGALSFLLLIPGSLIGWDKNIHYLDVWQKQVVNNDRVGPKAGFNIHSYRNQSLANGVFLWSEWMGGGVANGPVEKNVLVGSKAGVANGTGAARATMGGSVALDVRDRERAGRIGHPGVRVAIAGSLIALLAVAAIVGRRANSLDAFTAFGLACCATLIVSPLAWGHYFMAELPALLCVPIWLARREMLRAAWAAAVIPVVLSWSYYLAMPYAGGLGILGLGTAMWFLVACGLMVWGVVSGVGASTSHPWVRHDRVAEATGPHRVVREARVGVGPRQGHDLRR